MSTPYFSGTHGEGEGRIDEYIEINGGSVFNPDGWPDDTNFTPVPVPVSVYLGPTTGAGYLNSTVGQPTYYRPDGTASLDLVSWYSSPFTQYPNRLTLWPPPQNVANMAPVVLDSLVTCGYSVFTYPTTPGSGGVGTITVRPFTITITAPNLVRGDVGVWYGDTTGFYGQGQYLTGVGYGGSTSLTFTAVGLPPGLSIVAGFVISGQPLVEGTFPVLLRATDSGGYFCERLYAIRIGPLVTWDVDLGAEGELGLLTPPGWSLLEGAGTPINVPDQTTQGGWGIERVDVKVRREETA